MAVLVELMVLARQRDTSCLMFAAPSLATLLAHGRVKCMCSFLTGPASHTVCAGVACAAAHADCTCPPAPACPARRRREVLGYYSGEENAYDMRKAMPRDVHKKSIIPLKRPIRPEELEFD